MPHIELQYSNNIRYRFDPPALLQRLHQDLADKCNIDVEKIKSRIIPCQNFIVGKDKRTSFIHVCLAILSGRSESDRKTIADNLYQTISELIPPKDNDDCSITIEVREMDRATYIRN